MKTQEFTIEFAKRFKASYIYKMGGTQTIVFPNGQRFDFNDKEFYSGRGAKYNASIRHDIKADVLVSNSQLKEALKADRERKKTIKANELLAKQRAKRIAEAKKNGVYSFYLNDKAGEKYVELSEEERNGNFFDSERLAATLKISVVDANLLNSNGKTYVFAKSEDGNIYELYHPSLSDNRLSITILIATPERIAEFIPAEWQSAPYAHLVGQTENTNHFVC